MDSPDVESAGFGIRAAGRIIDYLVSLTAGLASGAALGIIAGFVAAATKKPDSEVFAAMTNRGALTYAASIAATLIYHAFTEAVGGASLGKRLLGLEVVSDTLGPATLRQTFIRNLGFFVDGLFFGLVAYSFIEKSPTNQRLGDVWGKTRVVRRNSLPAGQRRQSRVFVFVLLGAMAIAAEVLVVAHLCAYWLSA